jgi:hypothetical protein
VYSIFEVQFCISVRIRKQKNGKTVQYMLASATLSAQSTTNHFCGRHLSAVHESSHSEQEFDRTLLATKQWLILYAAPVMSLSSASVWVCVFSMFLAAFPGPAPSARTLAALFARAGAFWWGFRTGAYKFVCECQHFPGLCAEFSRGDYSK